MGLTDTKSGGKVRAVGYAWISADDKMPFESGLYLVAFTELGESDVRVMTYDADSKEWDKYVKYDRWDLRVAHWMPLPPLPDSND